jgi:tripeptide aminopeptidase
VTERSSAVERFLRYVTFDTQSNENSDTYPSTAKQLDLLRHLVDELRALGCSDATIDEHGYVMATIPATTQKQNVPVIGFIAHVDTSPEMSGAGVKPLIHQNYQGQDIVLPDDPSAVLRPSELPYLKERIGDDIITASGTTLLGADNKEIPHGTIRVGFTPDEEVGAGTKYFDVPKFGAKYAYTMDGGARGEIEYESFSADAMTLTFVGRNTHPGYAKDLMVNAIKVAADFISRLPEDTLSPETTDGYEGYVHPYVVNASVDRTSVKMLIRDFKTPGLKEKEDFLEKLARETVADWPGSTLEVKVEESYRNMREVLDHHPDVVENAREAIRRAGIKTIERPIRGGTDGSKLSFMGLPTPNVFAGEQSFHSRFEWVSAQDMDKAVEVIVHLARVWEERA